MPDMYAKLFSRITESSLMEEPINIRYTFVMMLAICDPTGHVIGTDVAIARRINMPLPEFKECAAVLLAPDAHSNSQEEDGRRLIPSDGERGYKVVNYLVYREMRDETQRREYMRDYMQKYRERKHPVKRVNKRKRALAKEEAEAHSQAESEEETKAKKTPAGGSSPAPMKVFTDGWCAAFKDHFHEDYKFQDSKDGSAAASLLRFAGYTPDRLLRVAVAAWNHSGAFPCSQSVTIAGMNGKFNEIRAYLNNQSGKSNGNGHKKTNVNRNTGTANADAASEYRTES